MTTYSKETQMPVIGFDMGGEQSFLFFLIGIYYEAKRLLKVILFDGLMVPRLQYTYSIVLEAS